MDNDLGPLFVHPDQAAEPILWLIPALLALVGIAVCLFGLVRGRLPHALSAAALFALPATAFALGTAVLMERSKSTEFCASCHVMDPVMASVHGNDGSLASTHLTLGAVKSTQSCYTCHSGYGIWGNVDAKVAGMGHMVAEVTGVYEFPLKMRAPFNINSCLACHAESQRFRAVAVHQVPDIQKDLLSREMSCTGACHPAAHPAAALTGEVAQ